MRKISFFLALLTAAFMNAQNDNCSGAVTLTVGTNFASGAVTSNNTGATIDGNLPSCNSDAADNVWFKVVVPSSGNLTIETQEVSGSLFDDTVLTVYSGTCGVLTEIDCNDDNGQGFFSTISLNGQTPGATLYISVWKYDSDTNSGEFKISAYDSMLATHEASYNKENIQVSPNPFTDQVVISDVSDIQSISVMDISGKLAKVIEKPSPTIYLGELKEGLYLITLKMKNGTTKTIKTIKK